MVVKSPIENSVDGKWSTDDFINILKHILAVIEDDKDLFCSKVRSNFLSLILKWRNVGRQSNWMKAGFFMAFHVAL